jgi:hypothetical protein
MRRSIPIIAFALVLSLALPCWANLDLLLHSELKKIEHFYGFNVYVDLDPRHNKILDLRREILVDFLKLKYKNNFANVPIKKPSKPVFYLEEKEKAKWGHINVHIFTAGNVYPIAYYVELEAGNGLEHRIYYERRLGYCHKEKLAAIIKNAMTSLLQDFAITFFKVKGEM